jgi:mRNA interferase RelE/StbE
MTKKKKTSTRSKQYNIHVDNRVSKTLMDYQSKQFKQILMKILSLQENPYPQDHKKLKGYEGGYRVDQGEYRILYTVDETEMLITIFLVGKRGDDEVYRDMDRKN